MVEKLKEEIKELRLDYTGCCGAPEIVSDTAERILNRIEAVILRAEEAELEKIESCDHDWQTVYIGNEFSGVRCTICNVAEEVG